MTTGKWELIAARTMLLERIRLEVDHDQQEWLKKLVALIDEALIKGF